MKKALSQSEIDTHLAKLSVEWSVIGGTTLMRSITCKDFKQALKIVNAVAKKAEEMQHHPDVSFGWGRVDIQITTHSLAALTVDDFRLATAIETTLES